MGQILKEMPNSVHQTLRQNGRYPVPTGWLIEVSDHSTTNRIQSVDHTENMCIYTCVYMYICMYMYIYIPNNIYMIYIYIYCIHEVYNQCSTVYQTCPLAFSKGRYRKGTLLWVKPCGIKKSKSLPLVCEILTLNWPQVYARKQRSGVDWRWIAFHNLSQIAGKEFKNPGQIYYTAFFSVLIGQAYQMEPMYIHGFQERPWMLFIFEVTISWKSGEQKKLIWYILMYI